jgi:hypothetical protein
VRNSGLIGPRAELVEIPADEHEAGAAPEAITRARRRRGSGFVRGSSFAPYQWSGASRIITDDG